MTNARHSILGNATSAVCAINGNQTSLLYYDKDRW
jgi:hypothetical protein